MRALKNCIIAFIISIVSINIVLGQESSKNFEKVQELGGIEEYLYQPNGMKVLLVQDNSAPVVTVQVVYRVGSKHEVPGNTGSTHLLEHLMFKGTPTFNKKKGTSIDQTLNRIGAQMNATTWNDRTNYYETIPSDKLETALHIEADRMRNALLLEEDKAAEMTVVRNEFERGENNPNSVLNKEIWATAYMAHPYHHNTLGWRSDIENMPIKVLHDFYNTYYWPDNATLTIIGDFEKENLFQLVDKYFGKITKAPHELPQPYTTEPEQFGPRRVVIKKPGQQAIVHVSYKIPGRLHADLPALTILGELLGSGTSSIISKTLVDSGKALYGYANATEFKEVGLFSIALGFTPDQSHDAVYNSILEMISQVKENGVSQSDVDRVIAKLNAQSILSRDGSGSIASALNEAIAGGDWKDYITGNERLSQVTAEDVKRVANSYLQEDQSTTGYFVPQLNGSNQMSQTQTAKFEHDHGEFYYRTPNVVYDEIAPSKEIRVNYSSEVTSAYESIKISKKGDKYERKQVSGIDVVSVKTGAKDFVTVTASFPIESYLKPENNPEIPSFVAQMLSKGTTKQSKFAFSEQLEKMGVTLRVNAATYTINIAFKCLAKDVQSVFYLLAEELRYPLFDEKEFELLKNQNINRHKQNLTDPGAQGSIALTQAMYPEGHPNYQPSVETTIKNIESITIADLKGFHKDYFGPAGMHLVAVGDVDNKQLYKAINSAFKGWKGGEVSKLTYPSVTKVDADTKIVSIPQKPSANMYIGQYTGLEREDEDFIPFYLGTQILGGGFSGRLMQTVRDRDGLTYAIYTRHLGHSMTGGYWRIEASFNPTLFQKGLEATMVELKKWTEQGVTEAELEAVKGNISGSFKVSLATTSGLASTILNALERGLSPDYIDAYPKEIEAVTQKDVNNAIKNYIDLNKLIIIKSGSLDQNSNPLN